VRLTVKRGLVSNITLEKDLWVHIFQNIPEINNSIKMEVGIEDCLHIEFEYNRSKYHLKDVIIGKIYFLLVRIKIKHMELAVIKRESTGSGIPAAALPFYLISNWIYFSCRTQSLQWKWDSNEIWNNGWRSCAR